MMTVCFVAIAAVVQFQHALVIFVFLFGLSFFFTNFGPNSTTFLIPSEVYPTSIRAKAHGISAAIGKLGAAASAFVLPFMLASKSLSFIMIVMAVVSVLGILTTLLIPEMKGRSLEDVEEILED
jgi:PHS family inorganic phosphate transporter-like MFS transporter